MLQRERPNGEKWGAGAHKPQISSARAAHTPPDHNLKRAKARVQVDNGGGFSFYPLKRSGRTSISCNFYRRKVRHFPLCFSTSCT